MTVDGHNTYMPLLSAYSHFRLSYSQHRPTNIADCRMLLLINGGIMYCNVILDLAPPCRLSAKPTRCRESRHLQHPRSRFMTNIKRWVMYVMADLLAMWHTCIHARSAAELDMAQFFLTQPSLRLYHFISCTWRTKPISIPSTDNPNSNWFQTYYE